MSSFKDKIDSLFVGKLWEADLASASRAKSLRIKALRLIYVIVKGFSEEQLILRAMSLVYTTLLTFVPLLAVSFSVLKAFGVHTRFLIFLYYFLEPLGDSGVDLSMKIIGFVENVKVSVLGSIGISMLIFTVISTLQKIERALNYIWNVKGTRGFSQRFSNYMSVLLVGPVLMFSAIGLTTSMMSSALVKKLTAIHFFGFTFYLVSRLAPYVLISAAFTMIYIFLPNTKVRFRAALSGGIAAAVLWQTIGWIFELFIASSSQYSAIYSSFAALILFLIWLYWNYLTLLIGARVSYYAQHPQLLEPGGNIALSDVLKEKLALAIMFLIGHSFHANRPHWEFVSLSQKLGMPSEIVLEVLNVLEEKGLIVPIHGEPPAYLPAKDLETITLNEIVGAVRVAGDGTNVSDRTPVLIPAVEGVMKHIEDAIYASLENRTLKDLILTGEDAAN